MHKAAYIKTLLRVTPDLPERFAYVQVGETVDVSFRSAHSSYFPIQSLLLLTLTL